MTEIKAGDYGLHPNSGEHGTVREVRDDGTVVFGIGIFRDPIIGPASEFEILSPRREDCDARIHKLEAENERLLAKWSEADALWIAAKVEVERLRDILDGCDGAAIERAGAAVARKLHWLNDPTRAAELALAALRAAGEPAAASDENRNDGETR